VEVEVEIAEEVDGVGLELDELALKAAEPAFDAESGVCAKAQPANKTVTQLRPIRKRMRKCTNSLHGQFP
jgi:hypothetical protein